MALSTQPLARGAQSVRSPQRLVAEAPDLEALPVVAQKAMALLQRGETTILAMADLLGTDQALASGVLRHANSGTSMPARRIGTLREALTRIGLRPLWELLVRASAGPMLDRGLPPYALSRRTVWRHAATTSLAARRLSLALGVGNPEEASVAGLLHDVGKTVLSSGDPVMTSQAVALARMRRLPVWMAEEHLFGFDHGAVGAAFVRSWSLPESVASAVEHHHRMPDHSALAAIVQFADAVAHAISGSPGAGGAPAADAFSAAARCLGVTFDEVKAILADLKSVEESAS